MNLDKFVNNDKVKSIVDKRDKGIKLTLFTDDVITLKIDISHYNVVCDIYFNDMPWYTGINMNKGNIDAFEALKSKAWNQKTSKYQDMRQEIKAAWDDLIA